MDTGASMSLICTRAAPQAGKIPVKEMITLESYNKKESIIPFTIPLQCTVGSLITQASLGLQALDGYGILGVHILKDLTVIVDLPNKMLCINPNEEHGLRDTE